ncbi:MAG: tyrosine-type recombinase/integrase [Candidatus Methylomirabilia bacterium]
MRRAFRRILKRAGLPRFSVYDLRHTFGTQLLSRGAPINYVNRRMGHSKPTTTLQWYAHWLPREGQRFVDLLDRPAPSFGTNS